MNPEQWLSLKWNGGSTMSDRWLNQSKIIHPINLHFLFLLLIRLGLNYPLTALMKKKNK